jgi:hypothetical protein
MEGGMGNGIRVGDCRLTGLFALHDSASHTSTGNVAASHLPHHMWTVAASLRHK